MEDGGLYQRGDRLAARLRPQDRDEQAETDPAEVGAGVGVMARETAPGAATSLTELGVIVSACDRFEVAWRARIGPRIEEYLSGTPQHQHVALLRELVALEVELR